MNGLVPMVVMLAGVNLVRATHRVVVVTIGSVFALIALALVGWADVDSPWAYVVAGGMGAVIVAGWQPIVLRGSVRRRAAGLLGFIATGTTQGLLIGSRDLATPATWFWAAAVLFLADPSTRVLRWVMGSIGRPLADAAAGFGRGEAIGVLERWITLVVVASGEYSAMGFILAAKALARHRRFETDPDFAEYFLIGTLTSVLMAILLAEGLRALGFTRS